MGNTIAEAAGQDLQGEVAPTNEFQSPFSEAGYEGTQRIQKPPLHPGLTSNTRKSSQPIEPKLLPKPPSPSPVQSDPI